MVAGILSLGLIVFANNYKRALNAQFLLISVFFSAWIVANLFSNDVSLDYHKLLIVNRLIFVFSAAAMGITPLLISEASNTNHRSKLNNRIINTTAVVMVVSALPLVVDHVILTEPVVEIGFGVMSPLYFLFVLAMIYETVKRYVYSLKHSEPSDSARVKLMGVSSLLSIVLAFFTNAVLPAIFDNYALVLVGPLFFIFMLAGIGYSTIKDRLFDITSLVIKSLTLISVATVLAIVYFCLFISLGYDFIHNFDAKLEPLLDAILYILMLGIGVPLILFFKKSIAPKLGVNNYNLQQSISDFIVDSVDKKTPKDVISALSITVNDKLSPSISEYYVIDKKGAYQILGGKKVERLSSRFIDFLKTSDERVIDLFCSDNRVINEFSKLKDFEAVIKLQSNSKLTGVVLLGRKSNGFIYTAKDYKLMNALTLAAGLALENALQLEEIKKFNKTLASKVQKATKKLKTANEELIKANMAKSLFVKSATHQIKPQITTAIGFSELLKSSAKSKLNRNEAADLKYAVASMQRISHAVTGILDIAGTDSPQVRLNESKQDIVSLAKEEIRSISNANGREYSLVTSSERILVKVDKFKICDVLYNLLDNADRYSEKGQPVEVSIEEKRGSVVLEFKDYGIGIKSENTKRVLDAFFRGAKASKLSPTGTGVGLYVVKLFVEAHGGKVDVESVQGQGSTFMITLPIK